MLKSSITLLLVILSTACAADTSDLDADQGSCPGIDDAACKASSECQQTYVGASFPDPNRRDPLRCLLVATAPTRSAACESLDHDQCRARADCSPLFWQNLGPNDAPTGAPEYKSCMSETSP